MIDTDQPMQTLLGSLRDTIGQLSPGEIFTFTAPDPDHCPGCYAGERFEYAGHTYRHHSWHSWSTLAHLLGCRLLTPRSVDIPLVEVRFQKLDPDASFHQASKAHSREGTPLRQSSVTALVESLAAELVESPVAALRQSSVTALVESLAAELVESPVAALRQSSVTALVESLAAALRRSSVTALVESPVAELVEVTKYHPNSIFSRIDKREEPDFLYHYLQALDEVKITQRKRILDLGVYRGDEFRVIEAMVGGETPEMIGIDHDTDAIAYAQVHLPEATFHAHDINDLASLNLGRYDLLISIGTLQSPGIETKPLVMDLVQHYLTDDGAIIFGWPNSRWIDGELLQGAKAPNYPFSELSLLIKDLHWIKKYLQQHRYRVRIFGQSYLFLVATRIHK